MPYWVIVGEDSQGDPLVLTEWILGPVWASIANVKAELAAPRVFRDRWRAKRQSKRLPRQLAPRCVRLDRL